MNSCDLCLENLSAYLDGELSQADKQEFEQHIQICETCAGELTMMKSILSSCSELEEDLPAGFEASLHMRLEAAKEEATAKKKQLVKIRLFSQIAAGFVIVIALGLVVRSGLFMQKSSDTAPQSPMMAAGTTGGQMVTSEAADNAGYTASVQVAEPTDVQVERAAMTTMKSAPAPSSPDLMSDSGELKTEEKVVMVPDEGIYSMAFTGVALDRMDGYDTVIQIQTADINKALDSILAIEKKLDNREDTNDGNLESAKQKYAGAMDQPVEIKLYYSNDELWQQFLGEMQGVFPEMVVESVAAVEEREYIRVVLQKME